MKAVLPNGVQVEGTPGEVFELLRLMDGLAEATDSFYPPDTNKVVVPWRNPYLEELRPPENPWPWITWGTETDTVRLDKSELVEINL